MKMISARNLTSHTYNERVVEELLKEIIEIYYGEFKKLLDKFINMRGNWMSSKVATNEFGISEQSLEKIIKILSKNKKIKKAIIYGSRAKGNFNAGSDIDITIVAPEMDFSEYLLLLAQIEELEIPQNIDLTKFELLDNSVKEHIKRVGKIVYSTEIDEAQAKNYKL